MPTPHESIPLRAIAVLVLFCCGSITPTVYAEHDTSAERRQSDAELNRVYQKALTAMPDPDAESRLVRSQRAWIAFRDAEMELMQRDGLALDAASRQSHLAELNNHRTKELLGIIKFIE